MPSGRFAAFIKESKNTAQLPRFEIPQYFVDMVQQHVAAKNFCASPCRAVWSVPEAALLAVVPHGVHRAEPLALKGLVHYRRGALTQVAHATVEGGDCVMRGDGGVTQTAEHEVVRNRAAHAGTPRYGVRCSSEIQPL